jgi:predicted RNA-binding protein
VPALEKLLEDVETVIETNNPITYTDALGGTQSTVQTTINSIDTDEGVLEPFGIGEMICTVQY